MEYCCHCGNCAVSGPNNPCPYCESLKTNLDDVTNTFSKTKRYQNLLLLGIHVEYLYGHDSEGKDKGEKRILKRQELLKKVSGLLNTGSGHILIHLVGLHKEDNYPGAFDEFADESLGCLINDGRLFTDVYKKKKLSEFEGFSNYSDFLVLTVEDADNLFTSDFKTKCVTDVNIKDINEETLRRILRDKRTFKTDHHQIDFEKLEETPDPSLYESREVQLKAIHQQGKGDEWLVDHMLGKLKLPLYVSAFSKNSTGGSHVAGVGEVKKKMTNENICPKGLPKNLEKGYISKSLCYESATINDPTKFQTLLQSKLKRICLVCDYKGNIEVVDDLVRTTLVPHMKDGQHHRNKYMIVNSVRPVHGLVFYDPEGPLAYVISKKNRFSTLDSITHLPFDKWFERMNFSLD